MAVFTIARGPFAFVTGGGTQVAVTSTLITVTSNFGDGPGVQHYYGSGFSGVFQWTGTVTSMDYHNGSSSYTLTGLSHSASTISNHVFGGNDLVLASFLLKGNDSLLGSSRFDALEGFAGRDRLKGNGGNDILDGGSGIDTLEGGIGNDTYQLDVAAQSSSDKVVEKEDEGTDSVVAAFNYTLKGHFENLQLVGSAATRGTGNGLHNLIVADHDEASRLAGLDGNDTLVGSLLADTLIGGNGDDTYSVIYGGPADILVELNGGGSDTIRSIESFTLSQFFENLVLVGSGDIDGTGTVVGNRMTGNGGSNVLDGGAGHDTLNGGGGNDVLSGGAGLDRLDGGGGDDSVAGGEDADSVAGGVGNDTLIGGAGMDTLNGGSGDDLYFYDAEDLIAASVGIDTLRVEFDGYVVGDSMAGGAIEGVLLAGAAITATGNGGANILTGNELDNELYGLEGDDTLKGAAGSDTLEGGGGDDRYHADGADTLIEEEEGGNDTLVTGESMALPANFENVELTGSGNADATGNGGTNLLSGNGGSNTLDGAGGNDTLVGGAGDTLVGGAGDDTLDAHGNLTIVEAADGGTDTLIVRWVSVNHNITLANGVENLVAAHADLTFIDGNAGDNHIVQTMGTFGLTLKGHGGNDTLVGGLQHDNLNGGEGNDSLDGGGGDFGIGYDTMTGGTGDDACWVHFNDTVVELEGQGSDTVYLYESWTLGANAEVETLVAPEAGGDIQATGNDFANHFVGNSDDNAFFGQGGADTLNGGAGKDTLSGGAGADHLAGEAGNDTLVWGAGDILNGGTGTDTLQVGVASLDLTSGANSNDKLLGIEQIDLRSGNHVLKLGQTDVLDMSATDQVKILGDGSDTVNIVGTQVAGGSAPAGFTRYTIGGAVLIIDSDITVL